MATVASRTDGAARAEPSLLGLCRDGRRRSQEVLRDEEGLQVMRVLGRNMAFLIRAIAREREAAGLPETEPQRIATNFI